MAGCAGGVAGNEPVHPGHDPGDSARILWTRAETRRTVGSTAVCLSGACGVFDCTPDHAAVVADAAGDDAAGPGNGRLDCLDVDEDLRRETGPGPNGNPVVSDFDQLAVDLGNPATAADHFGGRPDSRFGAVIRAQARWMGRNTAGAGDGEAQPGGIVVRVVGDSGGRAAAVAIPHGLPVVNPGFVAGGRCGSAGLDPFMDSRLDCLLPPAAQDLAGGDDLRT